MPLARMCAPCRRHLLLDFRRMHVLTHATYELQGTFLGKDSAFHQHCSDLMRRHRDALENELYANGFDNVPRFLCHELSSLCALHALYDHGEL